MSREPEIHWAVEAKLTDGRWLYYHDPAVTYEEGLRDYEGACRTWDGPVRLVRVIRDIVAERGEVGRV